MAERLLRLATDTFEIKIGKCIHNKKMPYLDMLREFAPNWPCESLIVYAMCRRFRQICDWE